MNCLFRLRVQVPGMESPCSLFLWQAFRSFLLTFPCIKLDTDKSVASSEWPSPCGRVLTFPDVISREWPVRSDVDKVPVPFWLLLFSFLCFPFLFCPLENRTSTCYQILQSLPRPCLGLNIHRLREIGIDTFKNSTTSIIRKANRPESLTNLTSSINPHWQVSGVFFHAFLHIFNDLS